MTSEKNDSPAGEESNVDIRVEREVRVDRDDVPPELRDALIALFRQVTWAVRPDTKALNNIAAVLEALCRGAQSPGEMFQDLARQARIVSERHHIPTDDWFGVLSRHAKPIEYMRHLVKIAEAGVDSPHVDHAAWIAEGISFMSFYPGIFGPPPELIYMSNVQAKAAAAVRDIKETRARYDAETLAAALLVAWGHSPERAKDMLKHV